MISCNQRPLKIVVIFQFYERHEDKRRHELGMKPLTYNNNNNGGGRKKGPPPNRFSPFTRKNTQIVIPISTALYEFRSSTVVGTQESGPNFKLDSLIFQVADTDRFKETLNQVSNVLRMTHRGVEDFGFDTREEWFDKIEENVRNTRLS